MIFLKSLAGGIGAVCLAWVIIISVVLSRINVLREHEHLTGLGAIAGGWADLLRTPTIAMILTAAFGVGLYVTARAVR